MTNQPLSIGILSFAHGHANSYAAALQRLADVTIAGIYDDNAERGRHAAATFKSVYVANADELLGLHLDGVIVCAENARHRELVERAAGKTAHILCEKPIAATLEDANAMIQVCAQTDTKLQIAFPVRFSPPIQHLKAVLDSGAIGRPYSANCTNHGSMPGSWFIDEGLSGGGAVIDHTVHVIDLLRWFWQTEVTEVFAEVGTDLLHPDLGIDDAGLLSFTLANGVYGTLDTSWSRPPSYPTWGDVKIEIIGDQGAIAVDAFRQHLLVSSEQLGKTRWVPWGSDMDLGLIADFVDMIRTGREPSITGQDGLRALEVALAAYRSAASSLPVPLATGHS